MRGLPLLLVFWGCVQSDVVVCDNGDACPSGSACDDRHGLCVLPAQLTACGGASDDSPCTVDGAAGVCMDDVCMLPNCGDGFRIAPELCDGADVGEANCTQFGFYNSKPPLCNSACNFDTSQCTGFCGDGMLNDAFEVCETDMPPTDTCVTYGYGAGVLGCDACGPAFDACKTLAWTEVTLPSPPLEIHGVSDNDIYSASGGSGLYHFDGTDWSKVNLSCAMANDSFEDVWQPAPGVVFASGGGGLVVRLAAGVCSRWIVAAGQNLEDVWAASADVAYVITANTQGIWRLDAGTWSQHIARPGFAIWGSGASDVYATNLNAQLSHFDGASWSAAQTIAGLSSVSAIWGTGPNDVYLGGAGVLHAVVKHSTNGTVWTSLLEQEPLLTIAASSSNVGAGITVGGRTYVSAFRVGAGYSGFILLHDGTGWTNLDAPIFGSNFVWAADSGRVYAGTGISGSIVRYDGSVLVSHRQNIESGFGAGLAANAPNDAYLASGGTLYHWDGRAWTPVASGVADVAVDPVGNAFGVSDAGGLFPSANDWQPDTNVAGSRVTAAGVNDIWVLDDVNKLVYRWQNTSTPELYSYTSFENMNDIWAASPSDVFLVGLRGAILRRQGTGWVEMTSNATFDLVTVWGRSATDVFAAGQRELVHYDGTSWTPMQIPPVTVIYSVWGTGTDDLFAGTSDGLWYFDGTQWTPVDVGTPFYIHALAGVGDSLFLYDFDATAHQLVRTVAW